MTDHTHQRAREALAEIEAGLEGVTPGPWKWRNDINHREYNLSPGILITGETDGTPWGDLIDKANAAHIARCDPDTLASIIALVKAMDEELADLRAAHAELLALHSEELDTAAIAAQWGVEHGRGGAKARIAELEAEVARLRNALNDVINRSLNDPLGTSKVLDMRGIAEAALEASHDH